MDNLEEQLTKEKLHENDSKTALTTLMTPFFHLEWPMHTTDKSRDDFQKYTGLYTQIFKETMIRDIAAIENPVQALERSLYVTKSSETESENNSSKFTFSGVEGNDADADIGPSYDSETMTKVPHSNNDTFENMFAHRIQNHEQPESIPNTYVVNENNSNIISDIPNMDPDRDKEEHDYVAYEQQCAFFASLINNFKCDIENCNEVNHEAQQAYALLTNELERYKEKQKHFAKDKTIESEYYKKIKILNDEISNLKSQACKKDKTFARENEKFDEYVQPF
ncbi:hypothetical protein Tco_0713390 [Tanacetum coccineum]